LGRPTAVGFAIVAIYIYAVKAHAIRDFSHVRQKVCKVIPTLVIGYPTAGIVLVDAVASVEHSPP
jgi:hypothetical protein